MKKQISVKKVFIVDKHGIRLNHPQWTGFWRKVDCFLFNYGNSFGLPCFLPIVRLKNQLVVDSKPIYAGGGVNCFNQPIKVHKVTVTDDELRHCKEAANNEYFHIRNFSYNGFYVKLEKGYMKQVVIRAVETNDPGVYYCVLDNDSSKLIPSCAIEGIKILYKTKETIVIPVLFGQPSYSLTRNIINN